MNLWLAILATSTGSIIGTLFPMGWATTAANPSFSSGKFLLLIRIDLELTEAVLSQTQRHPDILDQAVHPVVRHFISIPAGIGKMPLAPFLAVTFAGATVWESLFLLVCGMKLREHWTVVQRFSHQLTSSSSSS